MGEKVTGVGWVLWMPRVNSGEPWRHTDASYGLKSYLGCQGAAADWRAANVEWQPSQESVRNDLGKEQAQGVRQYARHTECFDELVPSLGLCWCRQLMACSFWDKGKHRLHARTQQKHTSCHFLIFTMSWNAQQGISPARLQTAPQCARRVATPSPRPQAVQSGKLQPTRQPAPLTDLGRRRTSPSPARDQRG